MINGTKFNMQCTRAKSLSNLTIFFRTFPDSSLKLDTLDKLDKLDKPNLSKSNEKQS